jgi:hypothetical protein
MMQDQIDEARKKADAWLRHNGSSTAASSGNAEAIKVGMAVGKWPSRFSGSFGRRHGNVTAGIQASRIEKSDGAVSKPGTRRGSSDVYSPKRVPPMMLSLMQDLESAPAKEERLSPAVRRYLPGLGRKWVRTKHNAAVRLSREGSGKDLAEDQKFATHILDDRDFASFSRVQSAP